MNYKNNIRSYEEEIINDLGDLIKIRSVSSLGSEEPAKALRYVLSRAEQMGLRTKNYDDVAGYVEIGEGGNIYNVLTHVDVVPEGENWSVPAFELTEKDGRLFGRGVADDKGAAIAALYALKAIKDQNLQGKNRVRLVIGTTEEIGMKDMELYFAKEPEFEMGFTPDADYGICRSEKGILQLEVYAEGHDGTTLTEFKAGTAVNSVPDSAFALIDCTENEDHQLFRLADAKPGDFQFSYTIDGVMIKSKGKAAHACEPEKGFNAATALVDLLTSNFNHAAVGSICAFLDTAVHAETNGNSMGLRMRDSVSGALTLNVGIVEIKGRVARATLDIRYPVTMGSENIIERVKTVAKGENLEVKILDHQKPLHFKEDSELLKILSKAYKTVVGEKAKLYSTGGGTYARAMNGRGVAFGPVFPNDECNLHTSDESIDREKFFTHCEICMEAVYRFFTRE